MNDTSTRANRLVEEVRAIFNGMTSVCRGDTVEFSTWLTTKTPEVEHLFDYSGQRAEVIGVVIDPVSAQPLTYDDETLPYFRLRFADGREFDAGPEELFKSTAGLRRLIDGVCKTYSAVRVAGYAGLVDAGESCTDTQIDGFVRVASSA